MIFKNARASILTNGFRSKYFQISRSMRQGCPISHLLYILQAEPLACAIRNNENIIGIPVPYTDPSPYHIPIQTLENKLRLNWFLMLMTPNFSTAQKNQYEKQLKLQKNLKRHQEQKFIKQKQSDYI